MLFTLFIKGYVLGLVAAAPIGPINVMIIRRGLQRGFWEAFSIGMGAVTADVIYLTLVSLGLAQFGQAAYVKAPLLLGGAALLGYLGVSACRDTLTPRQLSTSPTLNSQPSTLPAPSRNRNGIGTGKAGLNSSVKKGRNYLLGLAMTLTNPMTIGVWIGASAAFLPVGEFRWGNYLTFLLSVPTGCTSWVVFISSVVHFGRRWVNDRLFRIISFASGLFLLAFSVYFLFLAYHASSGFK
jgi:threonine/homoserine/homoserine lactone efflux protein